MWNQTKQERFATVLVRARVEANVSQQTLAEAIGVTYYQIGSYEMGITSPPLDKAIRIAKLLKFSLDTIEAGPIVRRKIKGRKKTGPLT